MLLDYILVAVFASFPEALLVLLIGLNLSNVKDVKMSKILIVAGLQSTIALLVRMSHVYFGLHSVVQIISLYLLTIIFFKIKYYKAAIPVFLGYITHGILQNTIIPLVIIPLKIDISNLYYTTKDLILVSIPVSLVASILLIGIMRKKLFLCDISD